MHEKTIQRMIQRQLNITGNLFAVIRSIFLITILVAKRCHYRNLDLIMLATYL